MRSDLFLDMPSFLWWTQQLMDSFTEKEDPFV